MVSGDMWEQGAWAWYLGKWEQVRLLEHGIWRSVGAGCLKNVASVLSISVHANVFAVAFRCVVILH